MTSAVLLVGLIVEQAASRPAPPRAELARVQDPDGCFLLSIQRLADRVQSIAGDRILIVSSCCDPPADLWSGLASERHELWEPTLARLLPGTKSHPWTFLVGRPTLVGTKVCNGSTRANFKFASRPRISWRSVSSELSLQDRPEAILEKQEDENDRAAVPDDALGHC